MVPLRKHIATAQPVAVPRDEGDVMSPQENKTEALELVIYAFELDYGFTPMLMVNSTRYQSHFT